MRRLGGDPPSPYEIRFGYSRGVAAGPLFLVSGTTSVDEYGFVEGDTPYEQARISLEKALSELGRLGAERGDVVQVRLYVTDISRGEEVGRALGEVLGEVRPVATMVQVAALIDPRMQVEVELVAYRER